MILRQDAGHDSVSWVDDNRRRKSGERSRLSDLTDCFFCCVLDELHGSKIYFDDDVSHLGLIDQYLENHGRQGLEYQKIL